jgi:chromosome segregation ATPase
MNKMPMITTDDVRAALYLDHWGEQKIEAYCAHVDELEQQLERAKKESDGWREDVERFYATLKKYGYDNSNDLVDENIAIKEQLEQAEIKLDEALGLIIGFVLSDAGAPMGEIKRVGDGMVERLKTTEQQLEQMKEKVDYPYEEIAEMQQQLEQLENIPHIGLWRRTEKAEAQRDALEQQLEQVKLKIIEIKNENGHPVWEANSDSINISCDEALAILEQS